MLYLKPTIVTELKDLKLDRSGIMVVREKNNKINLEKETSLVYLRQYKNRKVEVGKMAKEVELKKIISNLAKLGVSATMTKSRLDMLKALAPPAKHPQIQST